MSNAREVGDRVQSQLDDIFAAVVLEGHKRIVMRTPVDTGRARGNWNLAVDVPDWSHDPEKYDKTGTASLEAAAAFAGTLRAGQTAYITNTIPYIGMLEYGGYPESKTGKTKGGFSIQAPAGMVRVTAKELKEWAKSVGIRLQWVKRQYGGV